MDRKLPIYKLVLSDDDDEKMGVNFIAFVGDPAMKRLWQAFKKEKELFQVHDEDRKIISGALIVANLPIYRRDEERGEYYVVFDKDTIEKIVHKFFKNGFQGNVNMEHDEDEKIGGCYMFESFLIDESRGIKTPEGFDKLPDGSWFGSFKIDNNDIWNNFIKTGEFNGFSVEGIFEQQYLHPQTEEIIDEVIDIIQNSKHTFQKTLGDLPAGHPSIPKSMRTKILTGISNHNFKIRDWRVRQEDLIPGVSPPKVGETIRLIIDSEDRFISTEFPERQRELIPPDGIYILDNGAKIEIEGGKIIKGAVNPWIPGHEAFKEISQQNKETFQKKDDPFLKALQVSTTELKDGRQLVFITSKIFINTKVYFLEGDKLIDVPDGKYIFKDNNEIRIKDGSVDKFLGLPFTKRIPVSEYEGWNID